MTPSVACIMLTRDRGMNRRAIESFRSQTYENKGLLVLDTGDTTWGEHIAWRENEVHWKVKESGMTIGELRNYANEYVATWPIGSTDIFSHWDSDDWSHPNRLSEQVALLQASGADAVGYNCALFWDTRLTRVNIPGIETDNSGLGFAWLYRFPNPLYALGASLMYWRKTWERNTFQHVNHGEDERFTKRCKTVGVDSIACTIDGNGNISGPKSRVSADWVMLIPPEPRVIFGVHGGNTSGAYDFSRRNGNFKRVPEWDAYCRKEMEL